jgi:hypothetical protein
MSWWKRRKCASCKKVLKEKNGIHDLRLQTAEGLVELEICGECSEFWDKSAEVLSTGKKLNEQSV